MVHKQNVELVDFSLLFGIMVSISFYKIQHQCLIMGPEVLACKLQVFILEYTAIDAVEALEDDGGGGDDDDDNYD